jgi:hypothetical protein
VNLRDVLEYSETIRHEALRIAVLDMATPTSSMHMSIPEALRQVIADLFPSLIFGYILTAQSNLARDGTKMFDPLVSKTGVFQYARILEKLKGLCAVYECLDVLEDEADNKE